MNRRPDTTDRLQQRAEREARQLGSTPPPHRERGTAVPSMRPRRGLPVIGDINPSSLLRSRAALLLVGLLVYAVTQADNTRSGPPEWIEAQLDDSNSIPGAYVAPHPGPDGVFDSATNPQTDDRRHFANGTIVPICTPQQIEQKIYNNPLCYHDQPAHVRPPRRPARCPSASWRTRRRRRT